MEQLPSVCAVCGGSQEVRCYSCVNGNVYCGGCGGTGSFRDINGMVVFCYTCSGRGYVSCNHCGGQGFIPCIVCDGGFTVGWQPSTKLESRQVKRSREVMCSCVEKPVTETRLELVYRNKPELTMCLHNQVWQVRWYDFAFKLVPAMKGIVRYSQKIELHGVDIWSFEFEGRSYLALHAAEGLLVGDILSDLGEEQF